MRRHDITLRARALRGTVRHQNAGEADGTAAVVAARAAAVEARVVEVARAAVEVEAISRADITAAEFMIFPQPLQPDLKAGAAFFCAQPSVANQVARNLHSSFTPFYRYLVVYLPNENR